MPASAIGSRIRTRAVVRHAGGASYASSAAVTATPRSMSAPQLGERELDAASAVVMSNTSNQPMWPIRKTLPLELALPADQLDAVAVAQREAGAPPRRRPRGARTAVTTAEESSSGEKSSSPIALTPSRQARPRRRAARRRPRARSSSRRGQRDVEREDERDGRRERRVEGLLGLPRPLPVVAKRGDRPAAGPRERRA